MLSFRQYVTEKRDMLMAMSPYASNYGDEDAIRLSGLVNPSRGELEGFINRTKFKSARFILHDDKLLVWDAAEAIHADVLEGEYRLGRTLYKLAMNNKKFAYGVFLTTSDGLQVRLIEPMSWVPALLRKDSRTKHIVTPDVEVVATDDNGMPIEEGALLEGAEVKGWINPNTGKIFSTVGYRPYHVEFVVKNPKRFGLTEEEILAFLTWRNDSMDSPDPEESAKDDLRDMRSGRLDIHMGVERLAMEKGWYRFVFGKYGEVGGVDVSEKSIKKVLEVAESKGVFSLEGPKATVDLTIYKYNSPYEDATVEVDTEDVLDKSMIERLLRGRSTRGRNMTDIGRTMAMFR